MSDTSEPLAMAGLAPSEQAKKAILHLLGRIKHDPEIAYYFAHTQSWALLTEAFASLIDVPLEDVRESWQPLATRAPAEPEERSSAAAVHISAEAAFCAEIAEECSDQRVTPRQVLGYLRRIGSSILREFSDADDGRTAASRAAGNLAGIADQIHAGALT